MDDFIYRALLAGFGIALATGPLGCFVVWRRMSYFGAALSHAALLGIALSLWFQISSQVGILIVCALLSVILVFLQRVGRLATDTLLGILAHAALALGLVVVTLMAELRVDLMRYLLGDILSLSNTDVGWIVVGAVTTVVVLALLWRPLLSLTVHRDLAAVDGHRVETTNLAFMLLLSLVIAVGIQFVGLLLMVSMLIVPAAAARPYSHRPETMALVAIGIGCLATAGGIGGSLLWDLPTGPAIVVTASGLFVLSLLKHPR